MKNQTITPEEFAVNLKAAVEQAGAEYSFAPNDDPDFIRHYAKFPNGDVMMFSRIYNKPDRMRIAPVWFSGTVGRKEYAKPNHPDMEATVAKSTPINVLFNRITKLHADWFPSFRESEKRAKSFDAYNTLIDDHRKAFEAVGFTASHNSREAMTNYTYGGTVYASLQLGTESVTLELRSLPVDVAIEVAKLIGKKVGTRKS